MKKIPVLALVLAVVILVCASCARQEEKEAEERLVNFWVYNHTGELISQLTFSSGSSDGSGSITVHPEREGSAENGYLLTSFTDNAALHSSARLSYQTGSGLTYETTLSLNGDAKIILLPPEEGYIRIEPVTEGE